MIHKECGIALGFLLFGLASFMSTAFPQNQDYYALNNVFEVTHSYWGCFQNDSERHEPYPRDCGAYVICKKRNGYFWVRVICDVGFIYNPYKQLQYPEDSYCDTDPGNACADPDRVIGYEPDAINMIPPTDPSHPCPQTDDVGNWRRTYPDASNDQYYYQCYYMGGEGSLSMVEKGFCPAGMVFQFCEVGDLLERPCGKGDPCPPYYTPSSTVAPPSPGTPPPTPPPTPSPTTPAPLETEGVFYQNALCECDLIAKEGDIEGHPVYCERYYVCVPSQETPFFQKHEFICPDGFQFNPVSITDPRHQPCIEGLCNGAYFVDKK